MDTFKNYIQSNLEQIEFNQAPKALVWQNIEQKISTQKPKNIFYLNIIKFAVAAGIIGFGIVTMFNFNNNNSNPATIVDTIHNIKPNNTFIPKDSQTKNVEVDTPSVWIKEEAETEIKYLAFKNWQETIFIENKNLTFYYHYQPLILTSKINIEIKYLKNRFNKEVTRQDNVA